MDKFEFYESIGTDAVRNAVKGCMTPCFIYFNQMIRKRFLDLRECLPQSFHINFAVKANPSLGILKEIAALGVGADVASKGELKSAISSGMSGDIIEFSGPGKTEDEIKAALQHNVSSINAESLSELEMIARISRETNTVAKVGIRINPDPEGLKAGMSMSGDSQFGIKEETVKEALELLRSKSEDILFTGIHVHAGSQILSADAIASNFKNILDLALKIHKLHILRVNKINFGGGWGIKYFPNQKSLDLVRLKQELSFLFQKAEYDEILKDTKLVIEPGRFLVGECGIYVTKVLYRKKGLRKNFLIVDGGMHQHYLLAGGMGQVIRRNFETDVLCKKDQKLKKPEKYDIAGRLCTPQDILAIDFEHDCQITEGDEIAFFNSGAYGYSASPLHFLSHDLPAEIFIPHN